MDYGQAESSYSSQHVHAVSMELNESMKLKRKHANSGGDRDLYLCSDLLFR